jgi:hypothetical protein
VGKKMRGKVLRKALPELSKSPSLQIGRPAVVELEGQLVAVQQRVDIHRPACGQRHVPHEFLSGEPVEYARAVRGHHTPDERQLLQLVLHEPQRPPTGRHNVHPGAGKFSQEPDRGRRDGLVVLRKEGAIQIQHYHRDHLWTLSGPR